MGGPQPGALPPALRGGPPRARSAGVPGPWLPALPLYLLAYAYARARLANRIPSPLALSATPQTPAERIRAHINQALQEREATAELANSQVPSLSAHPTKGQDLTAVALLGNLPNPAQEPLLALFSASVERLIQQAYQTIQSSQINEFNQVQINTFFREPGVWQQLICFTYCSTQADQPIQLRHQLNTAQLAALDQMEEYGQQFLALHAKGPESQPAFKAASLIPQGSGALGAPLLAPLAAQGSAEPLGPPVLPASPSLSPWEEKAQNQLDQACLALSIALLDHTLKGDLFESTLVAFLAVLGVDPACQTFWEPYSYTSYLSRLVKMA
ncbi:hypothetical protein CNMCM7691_006835 [Aspergillus felis]|uniref:Uncharacterized protein n=1 Tax=Aspergillus felis TaxID=1287682 RepID=A0A8H6R7C4_9EURO|nr:hypothetical protein CNMCM7691_006835 [Aspergillus felis]